MKPKETQVLGLLITILLALIVFDLYTLYCITSYIKLTSLDVTTSFAVVDALFYQTIKLIILSYGIFALVVEIRGIYILRDRRNRKLWSLYANQADRIGSKYNKPSTKEESNEGNTTINDVLNEVKGVDKLNFVHLERSFDIVHMDRYGLEALQTLTRTAYLNLSVLNKEAKLKSLLKLRAYYDNVVVRPKYIKEYSDNIDVDIAELQIN